MSDSDPGRGSLPPPLNPEKLEDTDSAVVVGDVDVDVHTANTRTLGDLSDLNTRRPQYHRSTFSEIGGRPSSKKQEADSEEYSPS